MDYKHIKGLAIRAIADVRVNEGRALAFSVAKVCADQPTGITATVLHEAEMMEEMEKLKNEVRGEK